MLCNIHGNMKVLICVGSLCFKKAFVIKCPQYAVLGVSKAPWVVIYTALHVYLCQLFLNGKYQFVSVI